MYKFNPFTGTINYNTPATDVSGLSGAVSTLTTNVSSLSVSVTTHTTQISAISATANTSYSTAVALASTVKAINYLSSTRLISGGDIFQVNTNTIGISAGAASFYDSATQTSITTYWNAVSSYSLANVLSGNNFTNYILISSNNTIATTQQYPIGSFIRDSLIIGRVDRTAAGVIAGIYSPKYYGEEACVNILSLTQATGPINVQGNKYLPLSGMSIQRTAGQAYDYMSSAIVDRKQPNFTNSLSSAPVVFTYCRHNPTDGLIFDTPTTTLVASAWDDFSGTLAVAYGKYIVQKVYFFPNTGITIICHSQDTFDTVEESMDYIMMGVFSVTTSNFFRNAIHRCDIILDTSCTDVTDPEKAQFTNASKWSDGVEFAGAATTITGNVLPGVTQNKTYISVVDNGHFAVTGGSAYMRKSDDTIHNVRWNPTTSVAISSSSLSAPILSANDMRWCIYKWDNESAGTIKLDLINYLPPTLPAFERVALLGKVKYDRSVLAINSDTICISDDVYADRSDAWVSPARNISVTCVVSLSTNYLATTSGEMFRFPGVADDQGRHIYQAPSVPALTYMRGHLQGTLRYDSIINTLAYSNANTPATLPYQVKDLSNWYDNAGVITYVPTGGGGNWVAHRLAIYAGSNIPVWLRGQYLYSSLILAQNGWQNENFVLAPWAADLSQISIIAVVILKNNTSDFTNAANCDVINIQGGTTTIAGGTTTTWGAIVGNISSQTDLQNILNTIPNLSGLGVTNNFTYWTSASALSSTSSLTVNTNNTVSIKGLTLGYTSLTSAYTIQPTDYTINALSGSFTVTLPTAVGVQGQVYNIKNSGSGIITLSATSAQTIDGDLSHPIYSKENFQAQSTNTNWILL